MKILTTGAIALLVVSLSVSMTAVQAEAPVASHPFTIYVFLPWQVQLPDGKIDRSIKLSNYVAHFGIKSAKVIYRFSTDGKADHAKIEAIAEATREDPDSIVSFDTEFGQRFHPETVIPEVLEILETYRAAHPKAKVGVYATVPQNTYGWKPGIESYDALNAKYKPVADAVDFLSPGLYNYNGDDLDAWKKAATYNLEAARKYGGDKPIIPYITPAYSAPKVSGGETNSLAHLSEAEMTARLQALYDLGAAGCIVWGSSGDRDASGKQPVFDARTGWSKALVTFAKAHAQ